MAALQTGLFQRVVVSTEDAEIAQISKSSGAEIAAMVAEKAFDYLDGPILRVAAPFSPVPFSPTLEEKFIPNEQNILEAVKEVLLG